MNWYLVAGITPIILGVYQLTIDWLNLYPFNHPSAKTLKERTLEPLLNYAPLVLVALGYLGGSRQGVGLALGGSVLYLLGHLNAWWRPYFLGASLKEQAEYERLFKHTFKVLPPIKEHPIPDLQHMLLGLLVGLMVSAGLLAFLSLS